MRRAILTVVSGALLTAPHVAKARNRPAVTWTVDRVADPITGITRCTVVALDRAGRTRFTRTGALYPVVEMHSELGLLVGVSSGGRVRLPTGDILWRVDDRPFRTLRAVDNPASESVDAEGSDPATIAIAEATRLAASFSATSTMASGDTAREILQEMLAGRSLVFRQQGGTAYGLVDSRVTEVAQITREGVVPYPIDESFRSGLRECGIDVE